MVSQTTKVKGRDPVKREEILSYIRERVLNGVWKPGDKLPPRTWFEQKFDAAPLTVQRTFQILIDDRVLESEKRIGTKVSARQPHLSRYGVILYGTRELESVFSQVLVKAANAVAKKKQADIEHFFVLGLHKDAEDYKRLLYGIENKLFAGLFFATTPSSLEGTPIVKNDLPKVAIGNSSARFPDITMVNFNTQSLVPEVLRYFSESRCRNIAAILSGESNSLKECEDFRKRATGFGLECPSGYVMEISAVSPLQVKPLVHLLFSRYNTRPPEGLYVGDDNFLPHVIDVLNRKFGTDAGKKVKLVSQVNFPQLVKYDYPVKFFGFDLVGMFGQCIDAMTPENGNDRKNIRNFLIDPIEDSASKYHITKKEGIR